MATGSNGTITLNGTYYGTNPTITGNFSGTLDNTNIIAKSTELDTLKQSIIDSVNGVVSTSFGTRTGVNIILTPGYYEGTGVCTGCTIVFDGQNNSNTTFVLKGPAFTFTDSVISLINGAAASKIFWISENGFTAINTNIIGTVICNAFSATSNAAPNIVMDCHLFSTETLTLICSGAGNLTINSSGTINDTGTVNPSPNKIINTSTMCYVKGTLILTKHGYVPIEKIRAGHKVVTQGKIKNHTLHSKVKVEPVVWISKFKSNIKPICIKKNAFGKNYPFQDLLVSPDHSMIIHNKMIRAKYLVNSVSIYQIDYEEVVYYHLECQHHSAIVANGVLSETYVDLDNRHLFEESVRIQAPTFIPVIMGL